MLIGGLWHGAAWTFVAWGGLHGAFLLIHRWYRGWRGPAQSQVFLLRFAATTLTFLAVTLAWVLFRAETFDAALIIYRGLFGYSGLVMPSGLVSGIPLLASMIETTNLLVANLPLLQGTAELGWILVGGLLCFFAPNAYQFMARQNPALIPRQINLKQSRICWQASVSWAVVFALLFTWSILSLNRVNEFLYFQF
jgi:hypothetical protein